MALYAELWRRATDAADGEHEAGTTTTATHTRERERERERERG
jgi:hypothetical protein